MARILSRLINPDIARYINDLANEVWLEDKKIELMDVLCDEILDESQCPHDVLEIIMRFHKYSLISTEVVDHVMEYVWNYKYLNKYNDGPWVVHEEEAFQNIYKTLGIKDEEVENILKSAYE